MSSLKPKTYLNWSLNRFYTNIDYYNLQLIHLYEFCCKTHCMAIIHCIDRMGNEDEIDEYASDDEEDILDEKDKFFVIELDGLGEKNLLKGEVYRISLNYIKGFSDIYQNISHKYIKKINGKHVKLDKEDLDKLIKSAAKNSICRSDGVNMRFVKDYPLETLHKTFKDVNKISKRFIEKYPTYAKVSAFLACSSYGNCQTFVRYLIEKLHKNTPNPQKNPLNIFPPIFDSLKRKNPLNIFPPIFDSLKRKNKRGGKKRRKHKGINQKTGRLNKGYKYSGKKLKSGLSQIIKINKKK